MRLAGAFVVVAVLTGLCACGPRITEDTAASVTVRYDGIAQTLEDATAIAQRTCGAHGKTAQLRGTDARAALERFAHFNCIDAPAPAKVRSHCCGALGLVHGSVK